jgi:hypothetical protein
MESKTKISIKYLRDLIEGSENNAFIIFPYVIEGVIHSFKLLGSRTEVIRKFIKSIPDGSANYIELEWQKQNNSFEFSVSQRETYLSHNIKRDTTLIIENLFDDSQ